MKKAKPTFTQIMTQVADKNLQSLMTRARTANRLAKTVKGRPQRRAYDVKTNVLIALNKNFPEKVKVERDYKIHGEFVVVAVKSQRFGLHTYSKHFSDFAAGH